MRINEAARLFPRADVAGSRLVPQILQEASIFGADFFPGATALAIAQLSGSSAARKRLHRAFGEGSTLDGEYDALYEYYLARLPITGSHEETQQMLATARYFHTLRRCAAESTRKHITSFDLLVAAMGSMDPVLADFFEESGRSYASAVEAIDAPGWAVYPCYDYGIPTP